jgi:hypothetical protein
MGGGSNYIREIKPCGKVAAKILIFIESQEMGLT